MSTELTLCGKHAAAHLKKADQYADKSEEHKLAAGKHLVEGHKLCEKEKKSFRAFLEEHGIGKSRAYEVISIAGGVPTVKKRTEEEVRASTLKRQNDHQARKASVNNGHGVDRATKVQEEVQKISERDQAVTQVINWVRRQDLKTLKQLIKDYAI